LAVLLVGLVGLATAAALVATAFEENLVFFYSPSDIAQNKLEPDRRLRIGGLVEERSLRRLPDNLTVEFRVTDLKHAVTISYRGALPDLFREGQGVVAEGRLRADGVFVASEVLARHDENYMPPEVADALKRAGQWQAEPPGRSVLPTPRPGS
jgi:cytochrome c-type biogenesis protein CcmE